MQFVPSQPQKPQDVPYFDDVTSDGGWQGHSTSKTLETLKSEVSAALGRLGGLVTGFQRGTFEVGDKKREGFRISYVIERPDGSMTRGRLDVAALPVRDIQRQRRTWETRISKSLKMALYMLRNALDGNWFLQQLSPGYAPLMPWMLDEQSGKTITQLWGESAMSNLLLPGESEFTEGEFEQIDN